MGKPFSYDPSVLADLEEALSCDRFSSYLAASGGNRRNALELYEWNSKVSAAFYILLQTVEVALRNACHRELTALFGSAWHDEDAFLRLDSKLPEIIGEAKKHLSRSGTTIDTPRLLAELHFGFWTRLLGRKFEVSLWLPGLRKAFPRFKSVTRKRISRHPVSQRFDHLRYFRNRIAHHEPIFARALVADRASLLEATSWIYPSIADWTDGFSSCADLLKEHPLAPKIQRQTI